MIDATPMRRHRPARGGRRHDRLPGLRRRLLRHRPDASTCPAACRWREPRAGVLQHVDEVVVEDGLLTDVRGTLSRAVLSTPSMIRLMERAAQNAVIARLEPRHHDGRLRGLRQARRGGRRRARTCSVRAVLREVVDGRKLRFDVEVTRGRARDRHRDARAARDRGGLSPLTARQRPLNAGWRFSAERPRALGEVRASGRSSSWSATSSSSVAASAGRAEASMTRLASPTASGAQASSSSTSAARRGVELIGRRDAVGEPDPLGLLAADQLAGHDQLLGAAEPDDRRQPRGAADVGDQADARLGQADDGVVGDHAQVAGERELDRPADARAVDLRRPSAWPSPPAGSTPRGSRAGTRAGAPAARRGRPSAPRSMPEENIGPAPRSTTQRTSGSSAAARSAAPTRRSSSWLKALRFSGRLRTTWRTAPRSSVSTRVMGRPGGRATARGDPVAFGPCRTTRRWAATCVRRRSSCCARRRTAGPLIAAGAVVLTLGVALEELRLADKLANRRAPRRSSRCCAGLILGAGRPVRARRVGARRPSSRCCWSAGWACCYGALLTLADVLGGDFDRFSPGAWVWTSLATGARGDLGGAAQGVGDLRADRVGRLRGRRALGVGLGCSIPIGQAPFRWLLALIALALVLVSLVARGGWPRHAEQLVNAAGLAVLAIGLTGVAGAVASVLSPFGGGPPDAAARHLGARPARAPAAG